jgi:hypothetical protein
MDTGIGRLAHVDLGLAQNLHEADHGGQAHPPGQLLHLGPLGARYSHQVRSHRRQERLTEMVGQGARQLSHVVAGLGRLGHTDESPPRVAVGQGIGQRRHHDQFVVDGASCRHLVQGREGVAR